jgi:glycosyltransferase involved in cell wall biosynthesis
MREGKKSFPAVAVLISTFNGEKYLPALLESVLNQDYQNLRIIVRDDGSTDSTKAILSSSATRSNIEVTYGANLGVVKSFLTLVSIVPSDVDYVALCDQDDVWNVDKISRAVSTLVGVSVSDEPSLYCSGYTLVDCALRVIGQSQDLPRKPSFANALVENIATGCTIVFNKSAMELLVGREPKYCLMHDWWLYILVSAFGTVIYDPLPTLKYRQHSANVVGVAHGWFSKLTTRLKRLLSRRFEPVVRRQAMDFQALYGSLLGKEERDLLNAFVNYDHPVWARVSYAINGKVHRQQLGDDLIMRMFLILGWV